MQRQGVEQQFAWVLFEIKYLRAAGSSYQFWKAGGKRVSCSSRPCRWSRQGQPRQPNLQWLLLGSNTLVPPPRSFRRSSVLQSPLTWLKLSVQTVPRGDAGLPTGDAVRRDACPAGSEIPVLKLLLGQERKSPSKADIEAMPQFFA